MFDQWGELPLLPFGNPIGFVPASRGGVYIEFTKKLVRLYENRKAGGIKSELEEYREPEEIELDLPNLIKIDSFHSSHARASHPTSQTQLS